MEVFDVCDENGLPTGEVVERERAHREGILHRTTHVWIARRTGERVEILMQKRSRLKDSFPGMYDTSSAGHIPAGDEPLPSALRELEEELGIRAQPDELLPVGFIRAEYEKSFHGAPFHDNEYIFVFLCTAEVEADALRLQESEVEAVAWFDLDAVREEVHHSRARFCVSKRSLELLRDYLSAHADVLSKSDMT